MDATNISSSEGAGVNLDNWFAHGFWVVVDADQNVLFETVADTPYSARANFLRNLPGPWRNAAARGYKIRSVQIGDEVDVNGDGMAVVVNEHREGIDFSFAASPHASRAAFCVNQHLIWSQAKIRGYSLRKAVFGSLIIA